MIPYYIMLLVVIICALIEENLYSDAEKRKIFIFALLPVYCLLAFKDASIGGDTASYLGSYETLAEFHDLSSLDMWGYKRIEWGYKMYLMMLTSLFSNPQYLLIVSSLFVCLTLYHYINRTSTNKSLALFFFVSMGFFQFAMSGIRQTLAICIVLWSYRFIVQKKLWKFAIVVLLAMQFHKSAVVFAPVFYIANMQVSKKTVSLMFIGMFVLLFTADKLLLSAADIMNYDYGVESTGNGYQFFAIVFFITVLIVKNREYLQGLRDSNSMMINVNFVSLALWVVRLISRTAERVSLYFMPYTYVALEEYLSALPSNKRKQYTIIAIVLASFLCLKRLSDAEEFNNFKFFFQ